MGATGRSDSAWGGRKQAAGRRARRRPGAPASRRPILNPQKLGRRWGCGGGRIRRASAAGRAGCRASARATGDGSGGKGAAVRWRPMLRGARADVRRPRRPEGARPSAGHPRWPDGVRPGRGSLSTLQNRRRKFGGGHTPSPRLRGEGAETQTFFLSGSARVATSALSFATKASREITPSSPRARLRTDTLWVSASL